MARNLTEAEKKKRAAAKRAAARSSAKSGASGIKRRGATKASYKARVTKAGGGK